ncbi:hypothetical protein COU00_03905 [Candidatus Falkowbacteria bacterium CG10_big_fil_rev_8_21_14_0_10_43_11]|uniref:Uncharacterized protein n=1 Tax=Candidatus Falkowbacteria bacterium CG10_big_fil_rev_8_21_14_0_10_43_11 TaxID=1974568 RepID=A0A2M6WL66_9BACT|nr:MAG: hypothetical protein COU00_03905 [Candidatus Falkowbacteria bacterium CG10_big_fil_rev_8_21_14_0_10_43_11]
MVAKYISDCREEDIYFNSEDCDITESDAARFERLIDFLYPLEDKVPFPKELQELIKLVVG